MESVLFQPVTALLMDPAHTALGDAYVGVREGKIVWVSTEKPAEPFDRVIRGGILMPGLINCHGHIAMTAFRGYGAGHDLQTWLSEYIWPVERRWDDKAIRACTDLGLMEQIAAGTTCVTDMYYRQDVVAQALLSGGISGHLSVGGVWFGADEDFSVEKCWDCGDQVRLVKTWHNADGGRIRVDASLHGVYTSTPALWEWTADFAGSQGLNLQVHVSETRREHRECREKYGLTPVQVLDRHGVWDGAARSLAVHCVWTEPEDWAIMAEKRVSAVHVPGSNLKLGSGMFRLKPLRDAGVNLTLGTDGVSSNDGADLFSDMKLAALVQSGLTLDPQAVTARQVLDMATVNAAKALGRNTGSIALGKDADLILLDPDAPNLVPCHDPYSNAVYAAQGGNVTLNMCRGRILYEKGEFLTIDRERTLAQVREYALPLLFSPQNPNERQ